MLLTSSQVSVLISSGIVVLCTAALFLSGYTIQQRTLRDLRAAIKPNRIPRPSPKIYPQDDDTIVDLEEEEGGGGGGGREKDRAKHDDYIIVRHSLPGEKPKHQKPIAAPQKKKKEEKKDIANTADYATAEEVRGETQKGDGDDAAAGDQKPISRAERRRLIKEEIRRLSEGQEPVYYQRRLW
ncbi:hypothetical protein AAE478_008724 [Parahypoxylon ruwenzoriense]